MTTLDKNKDKMLLEKFDRYMDQYLRAYNRREFYKKGSRMYKRYTADMELYAANARHIDGKRMCVVCPWIFAAELPTDYFPMFSTHTIQDVIDLRNGANN